MIFDDVYDNNTNSNAAVAKSLYPGKQTAVGFV